MANKIEYMSMLAEETARDIVRSPDKWTKYLNTAARLYKYPFHDQILIYAQRPDATACAEIEIWNQKMFCWVNKGAKGIALIDSNLPYPLKYVFDVSDVHKARHIGRDVYLWTLKEDHHDIIIEHLEKFYGKTNSLKTFEERLIDIAEKITLDNFEEVYDDLVYLTEGSFMEGLDETSVKVRLRETLHASISYTLLARCNANMENYIDDLNFEFINQFNTLSTVSQLGSNVSELSKSVLIEISKCIRTYEKNLSQKVVEKSSEIDYNALKRQSENIDKDIKREGGNEDELDISEERRLFNSRNKSGYSTTRRTEEVRQTTEELLNGTQERNLLRDAAIRETNESLTGNTASGRGENGDDNFSNGRKRESKRGDERERTTEVGSENERYSIFSGGNNFKGAYLQLDSTGEKSDINMSDFFNDKFTHDILCHDDFIKKKKIDIVDKFLVDEDKEQRTRFIKDSYSPYVYTEFDIGLQRAAYSAEIDGLVIFKGTFQNHTLRTKLSWSFVRELIENYISNNIYLAPEGQIEKKIEKEDVYGQLSLFPSMEEQIGKITIDKADSKFAIPTDNLITEEMIDYVLLTAGGQDNSRARIYAKYQKGLNSDEMAEFLAKEYNRGGKGFTYDDNPLTVWYDENGMKFSVGDAARFTPMRSLSWLDIEGSVKDLISEGKYMDEAEVWNVPVIEKSELASKIYFFFRDEFSNIPDELQLLDNSFPKSQEKIVDYLTKSDGIDLIADNLNRAMEKIENGDVKTRFRLIYRPEDILKSVLELKRDPIKFPIEREIQIPHETFITQDEIDYRLCGGSNIEGGLFRIYEFFTGDNSKKEQAEFLKNEYGIGGSTSALVGSWHSYEDHDSKGIELSKGNIMEPDCKTLLSWPKVAQRIRKLIASNRFLSEDKQVEYETWKEKKDVAALERAKSNLGIDEDLRTIVALESTEDFSDPSIGFFTYHYQDGREGIRYRFVTINEQGRLEPYLGRKFFIDDQMALDYLANHQDEIKVIAYDDIVDQVSEKISNQVGDDAVDQTSIETKQITNEFDHEVSTDSPGKIEEIEGLVLNSVISEQEELINIGAVESDNEEVDKSGAKNFVLENSDLGVGTPKQKFDRNILAIATLKNIELEKRIATPEEQNILSAYVGWGGLPDAFDVKNESWKNEYSQLKSLLTENEYISARESTLNAHYTSPVIINSIYERIVDMGFIKGNVLEPAMGVGNFFSLLPDSMKDSKLYGVELDSVSGRIAKQLYPNAKISVTGFEKVNHSNDFFDLIITNVPFGQYKVSDKIYDKNNFLVHDYFFAKSIDKLRPGGIMAAITSKGTLDKKSSDVRKYLAQRAELIGAVRLPNNAFQNAGTKVTSDIIFLKKRDRIIDLEPDWVHLGINQDGISMNQYFVDHPEMIVGKMELVSGPYGMEPTCQPNGDRAFEDQLKESMSHIISEIEYVDLEELEDSLELTSIPADPLVKNFSFTVVNDEVYYRENSIMKPVIMSSTMTERVKEMVRIRNTVNELINLQLEERPETLIKNKQIELTQIYDEFSKKFGLINSKTNKRAFNEDSSYCLLCSLEVLNEDGSLKRKADMFTKRTIKNYKEVTSVDTPSEALAVSIREKAKVDIEFMNKLLGDTDSYEKIVTDLNGIIFKNPLSDLNDRYSGWETSDEYLSGNVREKLQIARLAAENKDTLNVNVAALERVQPRDLDASEIDIRLGAIWVDINFIDDFMREIFGTPQTKIRNDIIKTQYSKITNTWNIKGKSTDDGNPLTDMTYGTKRVNAYKILEDSLNLRDTRVFDTIIEDGKEKRVLNKKETMLASQKQDSIREMYQEWIFRDVDRREILCKKYNQIFNSTRPREFDGSHLAFPGMSPDITLREHQKNAVAHQLYGANTLLAHCVGAGKTFTMVAAAMELKRLGLAQKSLFVVPNHLTEQWASDFLMLYPGANILAATKKDFEPANRKKFCSRISTGDYDAIIIGHTQFEKVPLSKERQESLIRNQVNEITQEIQNLKENNGERYTIKQMEKTKKSLLSRLEKLNDDSKKDNVITFEQLGVDRLFVDESHNYKNLFLYTKMRNVAGVASTEAQKSSDMFAKCRYLDEITNGKGITFATGTPISNSMTELYTNMRYLQYNTLEQLDLGHFDSWAASFGETITAIELAPEGTGYRAKTRFAKFFNLPELMSIFKESADIQTADMLKLPVPEVTFENIVLEPSEYQKELVKSLADRAEAVRNSLVEPHQDNMLKITNDGRKLALDQRLIDSLLLDNKGSKVNACVEKSFEIWESTKETKATQLIFSDLSTPKGSGRSDTDEPEESYFRNVYDDFRNKLVTKGVPKNEIAFIHDANTEIKKAELFAKVRSGQVRFLLGSTAKMGAGTNVQDLLIAEHHLDVPWRPSDIEQREGRIIRQGNKNMKVQIFRYITEGTFDSYSWQLIENKQKFISQIMTSKSPVRSAEDIDEASLSYAEVKALATGNPHIKEKMDLDIQVSRLKLLKANHVSQVYRLEDNISKSYPKKINATKEFIAAYSIDISHYNKVKPKDKEDFDIVIGERSYIDKKEAGTALIAFCRQVKTPGVPVKIGEYLGFKINVTFDSFYHKFTLCLKGAMTHSIEVGTDALGNLTRMNNILDSMENRLEKEQEKLENTEKQLESAKLEVTKPFSKEEELNEKLMRLSNLNALLNMDEKETKIKPSIKEKLEIYKEKSDYKPETLNKTHEHVESI